MHRPCVAGAVAFAAYCAPPNACQLPRRLKLIDTSLFCVSWPCLHTARLLMLNVRGLTQLQGHRSHISSITGRKGIAAASHHVGGK